jgi:hypothetical protein
MKFSGEFGCVATDASGLALATLTGGTLLETPHLKLQLAQGRRTGKIVNVDYRAKTLWIDTPWPAAAGGKLVEIGSPKYTTSYMTHSVSPEAPGTRITLTRGADLYRSTLVAVRPKERVLKGALHLPPGVEVNERVASNDTLTKFWRVTQVNEDFQVADGVFSEADFAPSGAFRIWEYGVGDTLRQSTSASVRRVEENVYEALADADAVLTWKGGKMESSPDRKTWTLVPAAVMPGWFEVRLKVEETKGLPVFIKVAPD